MSTHDGAPRPDAAAWAANDDTGGAAANGLKRSLGVFRGTAVLLSIVIGAGVLTLPGLAVEQVGGQAILAWSLCAAAAFPLVAVFIVLGKRHPEAGGVASYARLAFGRVGSRSASLLFLGAVLFGLPSIALSGGHYLAAEFGGSPHGFALALLIGAAAPHLLPGGGSAAIAAVGSLVTAAIGVFLVVGLLSPELGSAPPLGLDLGFSGLALAFAPFTMLFFAFTGWEIGAGLAEEFHDPERDFPIAMTLSFAIATLLYVAVAYVAARTNLHGAYEAPFVEIVRPILGDLGASIVALVAALIVLANLSGAIWGVSRLLYGQARSGELPRLLSRARGGRPLTAVAVTVSALAAVLGLNWLGVFELSGMLALAGQNFLILYGLAAAVLLRLARTCRDGVLALGVVSISAVLLVLQGAALLYPALLVGLAIAIEFLLGRGREPTSSQLQK